MTVYQALATLSRAQLNSMLTGHAGDDAVLVAWTIQNQCVSTEIDAQLIEACGYCGIAVSEAKLIDLAEQIGALQMMSTGNDDQDQIAGQVIYGDKHTVYQHGRNNIAGDKYC